MAAYQPFNGRFPYVQHFVEASHPSVRQFWNIFFGIKNKSHVIGIVLLEGLPLHIPTSVCVLVCTFFFSFLVLLTIFIIKQFLTMKTLHLMHNYAHEPMVRDNLFPRKSTELSRVGLQRLQSQEQNPK